MAQAGTLLVVDDDEGIRDFVDLALSGEGYDVLTAPDGRAALEVVGTAQPALILLDMRMPVMNGWEFARAYRQTPCGGAPIVVITAAQDAATRAAEIEAEGYLAKPFGLQELLGIVQRFTTGG